MGNQDWQLLTTFFPAHWEGLAVQTNAVKGLRKNKSPENLLRVLLIHVACGYSLRETVVRAQKSDLAGMVSDFASLLFLSLNNLNI